MQRPNGVEQKAPLQQDQSQKNAIYGRNDS
jgi:hypothetical protein